MSFDIFSPEVQERFSIQLQIQRQIENSTETESEAIMDVAIDKHIALDSANQEIAELKKEIKKLKNKNKEMQKNAVKNAFQIVDFNNTVNRDRRLHYHGKLLGHMACFMNCRVKDLREWERIAVYQDFYFFCDQLSGGNFLKVAEFFIAEKKKKGEKPPTDTWRKLHMLTQNSKFWESFTDHAYNKWFKQRHFLWERN